LTQVPKMTPTEILDPVRTVLRGAARGKTDRPWMLTSYQVLDRLPEDVRGRLLAESGGAGSGGGGNRGAAHVVAHALEMLERRGEATATYMDTEGGYGSICKLYRSEPVDEAGGPWFRR
jgi:hypothetical protein